jgi:hypothetical protein
MAEPGLRRSPAKRVSRETGIEGSNPSLSAKICKANFGRESKIEIRDLILQDFRFGQISIIDFQNHDIHTYFVWLGRCSGIIWRYPPGGKKHGRAIENRQSRFDVKDARLRSIFDFRKALV